MIKLKRQMRTAVHRVGAENSGHAYVAFACALINVLGEFGFNPKTDLEAWDPNGKEVTTALA